MSNKRLDIIPLEECYAHILDGRNDIESAQVLLDVHAMAVEISTLRKQLRYARGIEEGEPNGLQFTAEECRTYGDDSPRHSMRIASAQFKVDGERMGHAPQ